MLASILGTLYLSVRVRAICARPLVYACSMVGVEGISALSLSVASPGAGVVEGVLARPAILDWDPSLRPGCPSLPPALGWEVRSSTTSGLNPPGIARIAGWAGGERSSWLGITSVSLFNVQRSTFSLDGIEDVRAGGGVERRISHAQPALNDRLGFRPRLLASLIKVNAADLCKPRIAHDLSPILCGTIPSDAQHGAPAASLMIQRATRPSRRYSRPLDTADTRCQVTFMTDWDHQLILSDTCCWHCDQSPIQMYPFEAFQAFLLDAASLPYHTSCYSRLLHIHTISLRTMLTALL
jgi:hypothetical protein